MTVDMASRLRDFQQGVAESAAERRVAEALRPSGPMPESRTVQGLLQEMFETERAEVRRLTEAVGRLRAENEALRAELVKRKRKGRRGKR